MKKLTTEQRNKVKKFIRNLRETVNEELTLEDVFENILDVDNMRENIRTWREHGSYTPEFEKDDLKDLHKRIKILVKLNKKFKSADLGFYRERINDSTIWNQFGDFYDEVYNIVEEIVKKFHLKT